MVIALGMRIMHVQNCALSMYLEIQLTQFPPAVVGNAYGYHIGKVLPSVTTINNIALGDARMASFYDRSVNTVFVTGQLSLQFRKSASQRA